MDFPPHAKACGFQSENLNEKQIRESTHLFKIALDGGTPEKLTDRGDNFGADWFDPEFALPVSPQPQLLTTVWGKMKRNK